MEAGKHILVEKPLDITYERAMIIEEARKRTGVTVGGVFQNRFNLNMYPIKKAIDDGRLGKLVLGLAGFDSSYGACIAGALAVIGHNWPVYFGFKGGKGVLTSFSVLLIVVPIPTLIVFALFVILVAITKYVSLGSIIGSFALPVIVFFAGDYLLSVSGLTPVFYLCVFVAALIIIRHHANIKRLIKGEESKLSLKK
jgi:glycerol-3-phosphate acyltransferase PlsY